MRHFYLIPKTIVFVVSFALFLPGSVFTQCTGGTNAGALTPNPAAVFQTMAITDGNYYTFNVAPVTGCNFPSYTFSFCGTDGGAAGYDTQITILDNAGTPLDFNDDFCGLQSSLTWVPPAAGTYRILINLFSCTSGGGAATLAYNVVPPVTLPVNPYFHLNGDAVTGTSNECVTLTTTVNDQIGCAWDLANPQDFSSSFSIDYTMNLGNNDGGADGMTFVFQNDPRGLCACGIAGGAIGASGISNSLIIEIDTHLNTEDRDDGMPTVTCTGGPNPDHLDIWLNGDLNPPGVACPGSPGARIIPAAVELVDGAAPYNIENGLDHIFRLQWTPGAPGTLTATVLNAAGTTTYGVVTHSFDPLVVFGTNTPLSGFTAATGGLSNEHSFCAPSVPLPIGLNSFNAMEVEEEVLLDWEVSSGNEARSYIVEHLDGLDFDNEWRSMAEVDARMGMENGAGNLMYQSKDINPLAGDNYYRLKIIGENGSVSFSEVEHILFQNEDRFKIYPNPAADFLSMRTNFESGEFDFRLIDARGQVMITGASLPGITRISLSDLSPGIYFVEAMIQGKRYTQSLQVQ